MDAEAKPARRVKRGDRRARDERAAELAGVLKLGEVARLSGVHRVTLWRRLRALARERGEAS